VAVVGSKDRGIDGRGSAKGWEPKGRERKHFRPHGSEGSACFKGQRFEVEVAVTTTIRLATFLVDEKFIGDNIRAD
jgi:hypothetical protein